MIRVLLLSMSLCLFLFTCTKSSEIVSVNVEGEALLVQKNLIEEFANLTEEFTSLTHIDRTKYDSTEKNDSNDQVNQAYAERFFALMAELNDAGVSEDEISAAFLTGSSRATNSRFSLEKATPCHDAHVARMRGLDVAAATCVTLNGVVGNVPGVLTCLVFFEAGKLVSEDVLRKCIER